jgi:glycogen debranching enzyme
MKIFSFLFLIIFSTTIFSQTLKTPDEKINAAFELAVKTIDNNTRNGILAAGADYGGEWTRDISINSWNGVSLLRPEVAKKSLWSVTINHDTIGHQYWDKIIWTIGALNHFKVTGDTAFLRQAYICSKNTIAQLEKNEFDKTYGLFTGPSVFNDGIAGYPEPIFDPKNSSSSVLDHKNSKTIKCLSTNCIYYGAYISIYEMGKLLKLSSNINNEYLAKADELKKNILKYLYNPEEHKFNYLINHIGKTDNSQEGLGNSFAIIFGVVDKEEAKRLIDKIHISSFGIASIYPDFPRYSPGKPGRHNNIVWPMVNGFWAKACKQSEAFDKFFFELKNLASLAMDTDKGNKNFREIYNPYTGKPDGGWQCNKIWESCNHQTWSATAFISMVLNGISGMNFESDGISFSPYLPDNFGHVEIKDLKYRGANLNIVISGRGSRIKSFKVNGAESKMFFVPANASGKINIEIALSKN